MIATESEEHDSGVATDTESRTQLRTFSLQKADLSDYGTDRSSPETGNGRSEKDRPCQANVQLTTMALGGGANEAHDKTASRDLQHMSHTVTCTVTICFAIPSPPKKEDNESHADPKGKGNGKHHKKVIEAPKAQNYFHFEYFLLPEDTEPTKVDVVMFGIVAKLYMDNETRLLKPWQEDEKTWLTWNHSVELCVTKDVLLKALKHQIRVRMWSSKDKVSAKARFDRPKAFRVSTVKQGDEPEVKQLILNQRKLFEDDLPRQSFILNKNGEKVYQDDTNIQALKFPPATISGPSMSSLEQDSSVKRLEMCNIGLSVVARSEKPPAVQTGKQKSARNCTDMKGDLQKLQLNIKTSKAQKIEASPSKGERGVLYHLKHSDTVIADKVRKKTETEKYEKASSIRSLQGERKCLALSINFMPLLAGDLSVTSRLQECSHQILDCYMSLALNTPLLSDQQKRTLNPVVIRILSVTSLPTSPTPISVLQAKCIPVYCKYRFPDQPFHQTHGRMHGTHVFFRDVNVVFAGTMSPGKLREFLLGPPIEVEVHDRDQKIFQNISKPSLFGMEPEDEKLSNVGLVTSKSTVHNPFMEQESLLTPYAIAKMRLSELVYGATYLNISVPIHSCESPDAIEYYSNSKNSGIIGSVGNTQIFPLPVGHYLDAESLLKVRVDLAVPLSSEISSETPDCPFGRIIYIFDYKNNELFQDLIGKITEINCRSLDLDPKLKDLSLDVLSRVCLSDDQKGDTSLDVITGIHIMDGDIHLFVLEGLRQNAIKELWETVPTRAAEQKGKFEILYNSEMAFHERLYKDLGVLVCHVHLHEPLYTLVNQPLLYIRDMVPPLCFQALSRLDYICSAKKLRDVIQSDLLPSVEMIHLLSQEFGVPLKSADLCGDKEHIFSKKLVNSEDKGLRCHMHIPLDNFNELYMQLKREIENCETKDHIQMNIDRVWQMSKTVKNPKVEHVKIVPFDGLTVHNYSSQTLNSTELALRILRQKMALVFLELGQGFPRRPGSKLTSSDGLLPSCLYMLSKSVDILGADYHTDQELYNSFLPLQTGFEEPKCRYTYSLDYQSATVNPVDDVQEVKNQAEESREEWMTPSGFQYPGFRSSIESNKHPKQLDDARILELTKAWKENILHANTLRPTLSRDRWSWSDRHTDFDLYKKPCERCSLSAPVTVHFTDNSLQHEDIGKVQIADIKQNMSFHRCLPQTEMTAQGTHASNQQNRLVDLLKDKGAKLSLRRAGLALKPIPSLAVIPKSESNGNKFGFNSKGFIPGELKNHSLKWTDNVIPYQNMDHETFRKMRGKDFTSTSTDHSVIYKRKIKDLSKEEKNSFILLKSGQSDVKANSAAKVADEFRNVIQIHSHEGFLLHIQ